MANEFPSMVPLRFGVRVVIKAALIFIVLNLIFAVSDPMPFLGRLSAYNHLFPGRERLPYSDNPAQAYSLSLYNLEGMFSSHVLAGKQKSPDEYRVILIGDSSTWGFLLPVEETLSAQLNAADIHLKDGRIVKVYNLGYPVMSLTKDLLILSYGLRYNPDLIIWPVTLESFPYDKQLFPPLLQNNPAAVRSLIEQYQLRLDPQATELVASTFWDRTILGSRRELADLLRLQLYGPLWAATGIDQYIPTVYNQRMEDLSADESFHNLQPPVLNETDLAFDVLEAGMRMARQTKVLIVNEPMFISQGRNSHIRYNFFYPRWAYDQYRQLLANHSANKGWWYRDAWNLVPGEEFTNSAVHMTPKGVNIFADFIAEVISEVAIPEQ